MAKSAAEKAAYNKEYYQKYKKKGLKKGRKKSTTKAKTSTLLGSNAYGLNDEGRIQAALIKEKMKKEMNEALQSAGSDEDKEKIRLEYSQKAMQQIAALRSDAKYAKAKTTKSSSSSSKSSGSKTSTSQQAKTSTTTSKPTMSAQMKKAVTDMQSKINNILSSDKIANLSDQEKADLRTQLSGMLAKIKKMYK